MSKIATQLHSMLEYLVTKAVETGKTGSMSFSIPYYDLVDNPKDYEPLYLVLNIETAWNDEELETDFLDSTESDDENEVTESIKNEKSTNKNKKH